MTKTEYREYISSPQWQARRKEYLKEYGHKCEECGLKRWLAIIAYDQDLHVHHVSYAHIGCELDNDLSALCRRCHEIKTFGTSNLHIPQKYECLECGAETFDCVDRLCRLCGSWRDWMFHLRELSPAERDEFFLRERQYLEFGADERTSYVVGV